MSECILSDFNDFGVTYQRMFGLPRGVEWSSQLGCGVPSRICDWKSRLLSNQCRHTGLDTRRKKEFRIGTYYIHSPIPVPILIYRNVTPTHWVSTRCGEMWIELGTVERLLGLSLLGLHHNPTLRLRTKSIR